MDTKLVDEMKKTSADRIQRTLTLNEGLDNLLRAEAARLGIPISHLVERAIATYLQESPHLESPVGAA